MSLPERLRRRVTLDALVKHGTSAQACASCLVRRLCMYRCRPKRVWMMSKRECQQTIASLSLRVRAQGQTQTRRFIMTSPMISLIVVSLFVLHQVYNFVQHIDTQIY